MSIDWNYNASQVEEKTFETLKPGKYKVRMSEFEPCKSKKTGMDMIKLVCEVSGSHNLLFEYLVFNPAQPVITNTKIQQISDSFGMKPGNFNAQEWIGKIGAVSTKIDAEGYAKISYFIAKCKQEELGAWVEPKGSRKASATPVAKPSADIYEDQIPY